MKLSFFLIKLIRLWKKLFGWKTRYYILYRGEAYTCDIAGKKCIASDLYYKSHVTKEEYEKYFEEHGVFLYETNSNTLVYAMYAKDSTFILDNLMLIEFADEDICGRLDQERTQERVLVLGNKTINAIMEDHNLLKEHANAFGIEFTKKNNQ